MNAKIRRAQLMQVPYMLVIGAREEETGTVALRKRSGERVNDLTAEDFVALLTEKIRSRAPDL